jgi:hypothetical protein
MRPLLIALVVLVFAVGYRRVWNVEINRRYARAWIGTAMATNHGVHAELWIGDTIKGTMFEWK